MTEKTNEEPQSW